MASLMSMVMPTMLRTTTRRTHAHSSLSYPSQDDGEDAGSRHCGHRHHSDGWMNGDDPFAGYGGCFHENCFGSPMWS